MKAYQQEYSYPIVRWFLTMLAVVISSSVLLLVGFAMLVISHY